MKMTYNEAIEIQKEQVNFYLQNTKKILNWIRHEIEVKTLPCPFDPDEPRPVIEINKLVPRGSAIETIIFGPNYHNRIE